MKRLIAAASLSIALATALCIAPGCASIDSLLDDWLPSLTNSPAVPPVPDPPAPPVDPVVPPAPVPPPAPEQYGDEVAFSSLPWNYGGFNGSRAALDAPRIGSLRMGSNLAYTWKQSNLAAWGLGHSEAGALACLFLQRADGSWVGGKFDWISTSRTTRDFENLGGYNGWTLAGIPNPCRAAFCIASADGRRRTNVIATEWRR